MSQQGGSSMVSSSIPNSQVKYQKALKQISKLINTNKILKGQCQQRQQILSAQLSDIAMRCQQLNRKYEQSQNQKRRMQQFMQQLQDTNQDLRKQYQTLQRQVGYLNDVLTEQNTQLKKLSIYKDQKNISQLIKSYQQKQHQYKQQINRLQEYCNQLKSTIDRIEDDFTQQSQIRHRYEQQYNLIGLEINKYRELNNYLMDKNQHILNDDRNRNSKGLMNQDQVEGLVVDLKRQLQILRNVQYHTQDQSQKQYVKNYQLLLQQKNHIALQLAKTKDQLYISQQKIKQMYEIQEKMSKAIAKSEMLIEQNNMLKNRITILQSKQIIDSVGFDQDSDLKVFQDKINYMINKTDPLSNIKNSDDNTHFITMKSFIADLQIKLHNILEQKQNIQRKYKNLKVKFNKKAEENIILEESHKLLKGKLQGYQRLAQKLNYQLQRSMQAHEDQIVKMVAITNNLVSKKVQQSKATSSYIKEQFDIQLQKIQKSQKTLSQQLQAFRIQNSTLKIKLSDVQQKQKNSTQLIQLHVNKLNQIQRRYKQLQRQNNEINQKLIKYQQLYKQQKVRHQTILIQKQSISNKFNLINQELKQKEYTLQESIKQKELNYERQIKYNRLEIQRYKEELSRLKQENLLLNKQLDKYKSNQAKSIKSIKQQSTYLKQLQDKYNKLKQTNYSLQNQLVSIKHKLANVQDLIKHKQQSQRILQSKNYQINDIKKINLQLKKDLELSNNNIQSLETQNQQLNQQINTLKNKFTNQSNISSFTNKQLQFKKNIQKLHEQIALLQSSLRDQKRISTRHLTQIQTLKQQIQRLQQIINKNKSRQHSLLQTLSNSNNDLTVLQDQLFTFKSKYSQTTNATNNLSSQLEKANHKISQVTQELNATKSKLNKVQNNYDHLIRDLNSTKFYIQQADKMVKRLSSVQRLQWQQQRQKDNISGLINALNRIYKNTQSVVLSNTSSNQQYNFVPASSFGNLQTNIFSNTSSENYTKINFGGSFGNQQQSKNNLITNDSFKGYSINSQSIQNVNFSADSFGRPSQAGIVYSPYRQFEQV